MSLTPTHISWTDETWNPTTGCSKVNGGCVDCYAIKEAHRLSGNPNPKIRDAYAGTVTPDGKNWTGKVNIMRDRFDEPERKTRPRRIFVNSMSDLAHESIGYDEFVEIMFAIDKANQAADNAGRHRHLYQILTKRYQRMFEHLWQLDDDLRIGEGATLAERFENVHFGYSASTQPDLCEALTWLMQIPTNFRWLSLEPAVEKMSLANAAIRVNALKGFEHPSNLFYTNSTGKPQIFDNPHRIDWVVIGGESSNVRGNARVFNPMWAKSLVDECAENNVPLFVKQLGNTVDLAGVISLDAMSDQIGKPSRFLGTGKNDKLDEFPKLIQIQQLPPSHDFFIEQNWIAEQRRAEKAIDVFNQTQADEPSELPWQKIEHLPADPRALIQKTPKK